MDLKKAIFADLEQVLDPGRSSRPTPRRCRSTEMAADLEHPERVVGFHFFNPVAVLPLVEVIRSDRLRRGDGHGLRGRQEAAEVGRACCTTRRRSSSTGC
jgi:hypothetical protein